MFPVFVSGLIAGALLAIGSFFSRGMLASPAFGVLPMLLSALPVLTAMLVPSHEARLARMRLGTSARRTLAALTTAAAPALMLGAYFATRHAAFIGQSPGAADFLAQFAWHGVFITLPLALLAMSLRGAFGAWSLRHLAGFLAALAAGMWLMGAMTASVDLRIAYAAYALLALVLMLPALYRPESAEAVQPDRQEPSLPPAPAPVQPRGTHVRSAHAKGAKAASVKGRRAARSGPFWLGAPHASSRVIAAWITQLLPVVLIPYVMSAMRVQVERGLQSTDLAIAVAPILAGLTAAAVYGWSRLDVRPDGRAPRSLLLPLVIWASVAVLSIAGTWQQQYLKWSQDAAATGGAGLQFSLIPVLIAAASMVLALRVVHERASRLRLAAAVFAGLTLTLFTVPLVSTEIWLAATAGLAALAAGFLLQAESVKPVYSGLATLIFASCMAFPLTAPAPPFRHFIQPSRFREIDAKEMPGGRLSLQLARDYDDPFTVLAWNDVNPLTSNPSLVGDAIQLYGHLPMFLAGGTGSVLVLGSGSGTALGAVALHHPSSIDCVEPLPGVAALRDSLARLRMMRTPSKGITWHCERIPAFLARSDAQWDVIISPEPFAAPFVSTEIVTPAHFRLVASHLTGRGVFAQWLPVASMQPSAVKSVIAAFLAAFPHADAWLANADGDNAMLCLAGYMSAGARLDEGRAAFETMLGDKSGAFQLRTIGLWSWADVLSRHVMTRDALARFASGAEPFSLFSAASALHADAGSQGGPAFVKQILEQRSGLHTITAGLSDSLRARTDAAFGMRHGILQASVLFSRGDDTSAAKVLLPLVSSQERSGEARRLLAMAFARRAASFVNTRQDGQAIHLLNDCLRIQPVNSLVLRLLMIASMRIGDKAAADMAINGLKLLDPVHAGFRDNEATIKAESGAGDDALLLYENAITIDPTNEDFYCNMAALQFRARHGWEAVRILDNAIEHAYYPAKAYYLQGMIYTQYGRRNYALKAFEKFESTAVPDDPLWENVRSAKADLMKAGVKTP